MKYYIKKELLTINDFIKINNKWYYSVYVDVKVDNTRYMIKVSRIDTMKEGDVYVSKFMIKDINKCISSGGKYANFEEVVKHLSKESYLLDDILISEDIYKYTFIDFIDSSMNGKRLDDVNILEKLEVKDEKIIEFLNLGYFDSSSLNVSFSKFNFKTYFKNNRCTVDSNYTPDHVLQYEGSSSLILELYGKYSDYNIHTVISVLLDRTLFSCGVFQFQGLNDIPSWMNYKDLFVKLCEFMGVQTFICSTTEDETSEIDCFLEENSKSFENVSLISHNNNSGYTIKTYIIKYLDMVEHRNDDYDDYWDED